MKKTFEDYLAEKHANDYFEIDDNIPDAFNDWLVGLQVDDIIKYADNWKNQRDKEMLDRLDRWRYKDHNPKQDCQCDKCKHYREIRQIISKLKL